MNIFHNLYEKPKVTLYLWNPKRPTFLLRLHIFSVCHLCNTQSERHWAMFYSASTKEHEHESCPKQNVLKHVLKWTANSYTHVNFGIKMGRLLKGLLQLFYNTVQHKFMNSCLVYVLHYTGWGGLFCKIVTLVMNKGTGLRYENISSGYYSPKST